MASKLAGLPQALKRTIEQRADAFINILTGLGGSRDRSIASYAATVSPLSTEELDALYHGADLARKIVDKPVKAALRDGLPFEDKTEKAVEKWKILELATEAGIWGRLFGAGAVLIGTSTPLETPLDPQNPGVLKYLLPLEKTHFSISEYDRDPDSQTYNKPLFYQVSRSTGEWIPGRVHASRMIMFYGVHTSRRMKERNKGFPLSALQLPYEILRDTDGSWRSVMLLMQDLSQAVFKLKGLVDQVTQGGKDYLMDRMEIVDMSRSVARAVLVDADTESFEHVGAANITGVKDLLTMIFIRLAAAADMPVTVLFGQSPSGMDATGASDIQLWHETVTEYRKQISESLLTLVTLACKAENAPVPEKLPWQPLDRPTATEEEDLSTKRSQRWATYVNAGVLTPEEVTLIEFAQKDPADVIDFETREARIEEADSDESGNESAGGIPGQEAKEDPETPEDSKTQASDEE